MGSKCDRLNVVLIRDLDSILKLAGRELVVLNGSDNLQLAHTVMISGNEELELPTPNKASKPDRTNNLLDLLHGGFVFVPAVDLDLELTIYWSGLL